MTTYKMPEQLRQMIADHRRDHPVFHVADRELRVGDIRRVSSGGHAALALVLGYSLKRGTAQITIVHPYTEFLTEHDVLIERYESMLPFTLCAQADIRGTSWIKDLGPLVSCVDQKFVKFCLSPEIKNSIPGLVTGGPVFGSLWDFKVGQGREISRICADCTGKLLSELD